MEDFILSLLSTHFKHCIVNKQTIEDGMSKMLTTNYEVVAIDCGNKIEVTCRNINNNNTVIIECILSKTNSIMDFILYTKTSSKLID